MFKKVNSNDRSMNVFQEFGKNWMLLSAKNAEGRINTMTIGWGMMGEIWGRDAVTVYVRQDRYTKEFIDNGEYFTVSLFEGYNKELMVLGRKSGRDCDKIAEVGFTPVDLDGQPGFEQSKCVFICKKLYTSDIKLEDMPEDIRNKWYADGNFHTMYIGEIAGCYVNE